MMNRTVLVALGLAGICVTMFWAAACNSGLAGAIGGTLLGTNLEVTDALREACGNDSDRGIERKLADAEDARDDGLGQDAYLNQLYDECATSTDAFCRGCAEQVVATAYNAPAGGGLGDGGEGEGEGEGPGTDGLMTDGFESDGFATDNFVSDGFESDGGATTDGGGFETGGFATGGFGTGGFGTNG